MTETEQHGKIIWTDTGNTVHVMEFNTALYGKIELWVIPARTTCTIEVLGSMDHKKIFTYFGSGKIGQTCVREKYVLSIGHGVRNITSGENGLCFLSISFQ